MANAIVDAVLGVSSALGNGKKGPNLGSRTHRNFSCVPVRGLSLILGNGKKAPNLGRHTHPSTENHFSRGRHAPPDIVRQILEWAHRRGSQLSARQQAALLRYRRDRIFSISDAGKYPEWEFIDAYFSFFDDMFFGGYLSGRCKIKLSQAPVFFCLSGQRRDGHCSCGHPDCGTGGDADPDPPFTIRICEPNHLSSSQECRLFKLEVLLHEMVHTVFHIYSCADRKCTKDMGRFSLLGCTGHGACWQDAAYAVERAVQDPAFINLGIPLARNSSLADELNRSDKSVADMDMDLGRWGFSKRDIDFRDGRWV